MEYIFDAFQGSFQPDEKVIFIANVKNQKQEDGDLMITSLRLVFYPAKPKTVNDVLFIPVSAINKVVKSDKGIEIFSDENFEKYEMEHLKEDLIEKLCSLNKNIEII